MNTNEANTSSSSTLMESALPGLNDQGGSMVLSGGDANPIETHGADTQSHRHLSLASSSGLSPEDFSSVTTLPICSKSPLLRSASSSIKLAMKNGKAVSSLKATTAASISSSCSSTSGILVEEPTTTTLSRLVSEEEISRYKRRRTENEEQSSDTNTTSSDPEVSKRRKREDLEASFLDELIFNKRLKEEDSQVLAEPATSSTVSAGTPDSDEFPFGISSSENKEEPTFMIYLDTLMGTSFSLEVTSSQSIEDLKFDASDVSGILPDQLILLYNSMDLFKEFPPYAHLHEVNGLEAGSRCKLLVKMSGGPVEFRTTMTGFSTTTSITSSMLANFTNAPKMQLSDVLKEVSKYLENTENKSESLSDASASTGTTTSTESNVKVKQSSGNGEVIEKPETLIFKLNDDEVIIINLKILKDPSRDSSTSKELTSAMASTATNKMHGIAIQDFLDEQVKLLDEENIALEKELLKVEESNHQQLESTSRPTTAVVLETKESETTRLAQSIQTSHLPETTQLSDLNRGLESISLAIEPSLPTISNRKCVKCQKKLRLTNSFPCKCGGTYCSACRYSNIHGCTFDYHQQAQEDLIKKNPIIQPNKLR